MTTTKVAVIGANGRAGSAIVHDLAARGKYEVYAVARDPSKITYNLPNVKVVQGEPAKPEALIPEIKGIDVLVSAIYFDITAAELLKVAKEAGAKRIVIVGGAGCLLVAEGGPRLIDTPQFPDEFRWIAEPCVKFFDDLSAVTDYDWTFFCPPLEIFVGPKVGKFRLGGDVLLMGENGRSMISYDDYATALVDEIDNGKYIKKQGTVAY